MPTITPEAKQLLCATIRVLRERLLRDIRDAAERRYRLAVPIGEAGLGEADRRRRDRLEAWLDEQVRASQSKNDTERRAVRERLLGQAVKEAGATLLNRLVLLRHLEARGLSRPEVVTGGWGSKGYREFSDFAPALLGDDTEGYGTLLQMLFDERSLELPGLFGKVGLTELLPVPAATLREVVTQLDSKSLESAWTDDTTLGWVYQYWNDPEREALDAKINGGGKIEPHEIASKTQMFTERYMVEWLLQNSLGPTWLCICRKNGWAPDADRVLTVLDARRAEWRRKREVGEVALEALMPIQGELEEAWKYYVPQPIPEDAVAQAPSSIRELKLLDPACGSGHFLVIAFDLLARLYREEARHRNETIGDEVIAEAILEHNLHGVDIDPRATQIAAAALYLKAKAFAPQANPRRVNLVAPTLQLGTLADDDPAFAELRAELRRNAGIPEALTRKLVSSLGGVGHLGTLLRVDAAVDAALNAALPEIERDIPGQGDLFQGFPRERVRLSPHEARAAVLGKLERFLARHSASEDLGLRLDGEQLSSGVRFVRLVREGTYDVVVGNPPYQGTQRMADTAYIDEHYRSAKEDLYATFIARSLELARPSALISLITIRSWMFVSHFRALREQLLDTSHVCLLADLGPGGFEDAPGVETAMLVLRKIEPLSRPSVALSIGDRNLADLACQFQTHQFSSDLVRRVEGSPIVYQWSTEELLQYLSLPKLGDAAPTRVGMKTSNNARFLRKPWEVSSGDIDAVRVNESRLPQSKWTPYIKGAGGKAWLEPLADVVLWSLGGLEIRLALQQAYGQGPQCERLYFSPGVAFTTIARRFLARAHRYRSIFDVAGSSVFPASPAAIVCLLNSAKARRVVETLNPTINFQVGDVNRLPVFPIARSDEILASLESAFTAHEIGRETSVEFRRPGPSPWRYAQDWAQRAVDRPAGAPLPPYEPEPEPPDPEAWISFGIGVALGRFSAQHEGILREAPTSALPAGILFVSATERDTLDHPSCEPIHRAWEEHGARVGEGNDLRAYLSNRFFDFLKKLYENRPIYLPLSSARRSFVALISVHRWNHETLSILLADHLLPERRRLEGELEDIRKARAQSSGEDKAETRFANARRWLEELGDFIDKVTEIAERGPPDPDPKTPKREVDVRFTPDLDDGVMVNSAALWPLLEPQWKDPKKWWKELATAEGRRDYDWAHLAARYFPTRVRAKCQQDPSLSVAHQCFWALHPAKAYAWELRLQDELDPSFKIGEPGSDQARARFLEEHPDEARAIEMSEQNRRERRRPGTAASSTPGAGLPSPGSI